MATPRLEILKGMVERNPKDSFSRYGLAMEYRNAGQPEAAVAEFQALLATDPDYVPAYYHYGRTLESLGRAGEARAAYRAGIESATRKGDQHARMELEAELASLG